MAESQLGIMEVPPGSNDGPDVIKFLHSAGANAGDAWCMAFVHWCVQEAAKPAPCPAPVSAGVLDVLNTTRQNHPGRFISKASVLANLGQVQTGWVFILDHGHGHGHTGFVKSLHNGGALRTIEGNTNNTASSEGVGVFELQRRSVTDDELVGFIDFSRP